MEPGLGEEEHRMQDVCNDMLTSQRLGLTDYNALQVKGFAQ